MDRRRRCINTYHISDPNLTELVSQCSRGSQFLGSRAPGPVASIRIYYELALSGELISFPKTTVPVGLTFFPKELVRSPKACVPIPSSGYSWPMRDDERGVVCYVPKEGPCSSRRTRSADTLRPSTSSPKHSWATFGKCSASLDPQASSRDVPAIDRKERIMVV